MKKRFLSAVLLAVCVLTVSAQTGKADQVLSLARKVNSHFVSNHPDPTEDTHVGGKTRPSSLWTRAVYYEGLTALYDIDPQQQYLDYIDCWARYHKWTPRNGIATTDADDQCCAQTYIWRYRLVQDRRMIENVRENLDHQIATGKDSYWWWIDAIQMAMPTYAMFFTCSGEHKYLDYAMKCYRWSRNVEGGGLYHEKAGLWWRDKRFVSPYTEEDGKACYWSRGNGWVYAAIVRVLNELKPRLGVDPQVHPYYEELLKDYRAMSNALLKCQRNDGFWNASLVSSAYAGMELSGTALFLYGMSWGIANGVLKRKAYRTACDKAYEGIAGNCIHANGKLGFVQGTGSQPADSQPVTFEKTPDFDDYGTGCFLLGFTAYQELLK